MEIDNYRIMKNGIKQETTGYRPQNYSNWHRTLSKYCLAFDVDFVEYRLHRGIVGIFEIKQFTNITQLLKNKDFVINNSTNQIKVYRLLTSDTVYNAYFVLHTSDMKYFEVWNLNKNKNPYFDIYDERGYIKWIETL